MTTTGKLCKATTKDGEPCRCYAIEGGEFCYWHDPTKAAQRKEARAKGGRARHGRDLGSGGQERPTVKIDSLADVITVLAGELADVLRLERSISRARAVGYLCSVLATIYKDSELEQRIAALEAHTG